MIYCHRLGVIAVVLGLAAGVSVSAQGKGDDAAAQKVGDAFTAAISKGDGKAAAALFTPDGDYVSSTGRTAQGPAEIEKLVREQAAGPFKGLTFSTKTVSTRMIAPDVLLGNATFESTGQPPRKGMTTMVLVRQKGEWKIAALRAMVPAAGS